MIATDDKKRVTLSRLAASVLLAAAVVLAGSGTSAACVSQVPTPIAQIVGETSGEPGDLKVVAVVEFDTVREWPAVQDYSVGSVSVPTRIWGAAEAPYPSRYSGGEYVGASATTNDCGPAMAHPIGTRDYFYVVTGSASLQPILERDLAASDEAGLAVRLGAADQLALPILPDGFPYPDPPLPVDNSPGSRSSPWPLIALASATGAVALFLYAYQATEPEQE